MVIMISVTIDTYPLKQSILRKQKLLEMNVDNKLKFGHEP